MRSPKDMTWLVHCSPYRRGWGRARRRERNRGLPLRLRGAGDALMGEDSSELCRDVVWTPPWVVAPQREVKKHGEHTDVVSASVRLVRWVSQFREPSARFLQFLWKTSLVD